jgi:predicted PurR-regulated permease PerM
MEHAHPERVRSNHPIDRIDVQGSTSGERREGSMVTHERTQPVAVWRPPAPTAVRTVTTALLLGSSVAAASYVALVLAGAPLAEPAAVLAGLCGALPRVGAVLAGLICVTLIEAPAMELLAAGLVAGIDLLHRRILQPRLYAAGGALSPAVAAASLLFAAAFAGMPGAVVALPVVAAVMAAVLRRPIERP